MSDDDDDDDDDLRGKTRSGDSAAISFWWVYRKSVRRSVADMLVTSNCISAIIIIIIIIISINLSIFIPKCTRSSMTFT